MPGSRAALGVPLVSLGGHGLSTPFSSSLTGSKRPDAFMLLCVLGIGRYRRTGWVEKGWTAKLCGALDRHCQSVATNGACSSTPRTHQGTPSPPSRRMQIDCWCRYCLRGQGAGLLPSCPTELGSIDPHPMQNNSELAGEGHFSELHAAPLCDPHCPATQARPAPMMHQDVRGLIEGSAHHFIAAAADVSVIIDLPGAVASRC
jgi:hypothetical protein